MMKTHFNDHFELNALPYFKIGPQGHIELADPDIGPIIDMHTHLALGLKGPLHVDLEREHPQAKHYLPLEQPLDLNVYANKNYTPKNIRNIKQDMTILAPLPFGHKQTHTAPNIIRDMQALAITHSVILAIDLPVLTNNAERYLDISQKHPALLTFGSVHPLASKAKHKLEEQISRGIKGLKYHPAAQMLAPDHPKALELFEICEQHRIPVLFHCGPVGIEPKSGAKRSQVSLYEQALRDFPNLPFILGHSGALQMPQALNLANRYDNAWLELSSQSLPNVQQILDEGPKERLVYGSDWPFYHQSVPLAKIFIAAKDDTTLRTMVLYENAARLLKL